MATTLTHLPLLFILSFLLSIPFRNNSSAAAATTKAGFRLRLIHRDSPLSPFYNPNATTFDRANLALRRDIARREYIRSALQSHSFNPNSFQGPVTTPEGSYLLKLQIGNPPFELFANVDTASNLLWVQCLPCTNCYKQKDPIYNPWLSSTYATADCKSPQCQAAPEDQCGAANECLYSSQYGDGSYTSGVLAKEAFAFESLDKGLPNVTFRDIAFGCGHNNSGKFQVTEAGILGFGRGPLSLVNQFGSATNYKFSYCFVPHTDPTVGSQLIFGDRAVIGPSTPFFSLTGAESSFYYLTVTGITVGNESLMIPEGIFNPRPDNTGGFIIDSGTTITWLPPEVCAQMFKSMKAQISLPMINDPFRFLQLCFKAGYEEALDFPVITFHFAERHNVPLFPQYTFEFRPNRVACLGVRRLPRVIYSSIFGGWFQQNLNVGYDLKKGRVAFAPTECSSFVIGGN